MITCENCGHELPYLTCPYCDGHNLKNASYCSHCGDPLPGESDLDPDDTGHYGMDDRILCQDEACIGILENGICSECGKPQTGQTA